MNMEEYSFSVQIRAVEEGGYVGFVPALPGCHTQGDTLDEAIANLREALQGYLASLIRRGRDIPVEPIPFNTAGLRLSVSTPAIR